MMVVPHPCGTCLDIGSLTDSDLPNQMLSPRNPSSVN